MKRILVPTDFSNTANNALRFALDLAAKHDCTLKVVHVYRPNFEMADAHLSDEVSFTMLGETEERLATLIADEIKLVEKGSVDLANIVEHEVAVGFPVEEILGLSEMSGVDLIIMGTSGERGFLEKIFGSISINVGQRAQCPVLLVPPEVIFHGFRHILYASDYEAAERPWLQKLVDLAERFKADVHFVHVEEQEKLGSYEAIQNRWHNQLFEGKEPPFAFTMDKVSGQTVAQGLNDYAVRHRIDLVVMARPNREFWESIFHKSATKAMALNTKLPILIFHE